MGCNHISNCFESRGTYGAFVVARDGIQPMVCHATIDDNYLHDNHLREVKETKAYRRELKQKGKKVRALREDMLHDELVVVFGSKMSAASAVKRLRELAKNIEKNGMLVGINMSGEYVTETVDGSFHG
jgi:hypothetical protein